MQNQFNDCVSKTIIVDKMFNFQNIQCLYKNTEMIQKNEQNVQNPKIKILNNLCKNDGDKLIKKTNIILPDRQISIEDVYEFKFSRQVNNLFQKGKNVAPANSTDGSQLQRVAQAEEDKLAYKKKKLIFKKKSHGDDFNKHFEKRNTKNIAKNFCKAFFSYLTENKMHYDLSKFNSLAETENYNNRLIVKIVSDQELKSTFREFLKRRAQEWIKGSKIVDKNIHLQAINLYLNMTNYRNQEGWNKVHEESDDIMENDEIFCEDSDYNEGKQKHFSI